MQTVITCGEGANAYQVTFEFGLFDVEGKKVVAQALNHSDVAGKEGEELVAALVQKLLKDRYFIVNREKDGKPNDGPNGEPARQAFNPDGKPSFVQHFKNGELNDSINGEPAFQRFDQLDIIGQMAEVRYFADGQKTAGQDWYYGFETMGRLKKLFASSAAKNERVCIVRMYYYKEDGIYTPMHGKPYKGAVRNDGPNGEPGTQAWELLYDATKGQPSLEEVREKATLVFARHEKGGESGKELSRRARRKAEKQWPLSKQPAAQV